MDLGNPWGSQSKSSQLGSEIPGVTFSFFGWFHSLQNKYGMTWCSSSNVPSTTAGDVDASRSVPLGTCASSLPLPWSPCAMPRNAPHCPSRSGMSPASGHRSSSRNAGGTTPCIAFAACSGRGNSASSRSCARCDGVLSSRSSRLAISFISNTIGPRAPGAPCLPLSRRS